MRRRHARTSSHISCPHARLAFPTPQYRNHRCNSTSIYITQIAKSLKPFQITALYQLVMWSEKNLFLVSDGGSTSRSVSTMLSETFFCEQFVNSNPNTWYVKMRRIWWRSVCTGRFQQNLLNKFRYPYIQSVVSLIFPMNVNNLTDKLTDC
jgi:hypothetical protein